MIDKLQASHPPLKTPPAAAPRALRLLLLVVLAAFGQPLAAAPKTDVVVLKNGDHITARHPHQAAMAEALGATTVLAHVPGAKAVVKLDDLPITPRVGQDGAFEPPSFGQLAVALLPPTAAALAWSLAQALVAAIS
jgi:hypothetical protein